MLHFRFLFVHAHVPGQQATHPLRPRIKVPMANVSDTRGAPVAASPSWLHGAVVEVLCHCFRLLVGGCTVQEPPAPSSRISVPPCSWRALRALLVGAPAPSSGGCTCLPACLSGDMLEAFVLGRRVSEDGPHVSVSNGIMPRAEAIASRQPTTPCTLTF